MSNYYRYHTWYLFQLIKKLSKKRRTIKGNAGKKWSLTISNLSWQKTGKKFRTAFVFDHTISHRFNYNQVSPNLKFPPFQIEYSQFSNSRRARLRRFNFPRFRFAHNSTDIPPLPRPPLPPLFFREIRATSNSNVGYGFEGGRDSSRYPLFPLPPLPSLLPHPLVSKGGRRKKITRMEKKIVEDRHPNEHFNLRGILNK